MSSPWDYGSTRARSGREERAGPEAGALPQRRRARRGGAAVGSLDGQVGNRPAQTPEILSFTLKPAISPLGLSWGYRYEYDPFVDMRVRVRVNPRLGLTLTLTLDMKRGYPLRSL